MMTVKFDSREFLKDIKGALGYSAGFLDGVQRGKPILMKNMGIQIKEILYSFVDSMARMDPQKLHHIYEWYETGSPTARLYEVDYIVSGAGLTFNYTFSQSRSVKQGSREPFYNKASIMENGIPVVIRPKFAQVLSFNDDGEQVFTKGPVKVENPGGIRSTGGLSDTLKTFFDRYLSQSILDVTGIRVQLLDVSIFKKYFSASKTGGYQLGLTTGLKWISKIGTI